MRVGLGLSSSLEVYYLSWDLKSLSLALRRPDEMPVTSDMMAYKAVVEAEWKHSTAVLDPQRGSNP